MHKPAASKNKTMAVPRGGRAAQAAEAGACGEALRALLFAAASPDNLDAFLLRVINTLCRQDALGPDTGLAIVLRPGKTTPPLNIFLNFTPEERRRLSRISGPGAIWPRNISAAIRGGTAKGFLLARLPRRASRACALRLLEIAAKTISGRLSQEAREGQLTRERDVADAITHLEELYLAFPSISLAEISRTVLDEARRLTGSRIGFAGYINPATGWLNVPAFTAELRRSCPLDGKELVFRKFKGLPGWVLRNQKPLLTNSAASDPRAVHFHGDPVKIEKFAAAPAISGKELIGILALANPPGDYTPAALEAVTKLARVYALMLHHKLSEQRAAARLAESEMKYKKLFDKANAAIIIADTATGVILDANKDAEKLTGRPRKELIGMNRLKLHPREKAGHYIRQFREHTRKGLTTLADAEIARKDGSRTQVQISASVLKLGDREVIQGIFNDVSDRVRMQKLLAENEETMRRIFETTTDAIFLKDISGRYLKANKACAGLFRMKTEEMLGRSDADLFSSEIAAESLKDDAEVMRLGETLFFSKERILPSGKSYLSVAKTPLRGAGGEITGLLGVVRDITGIKKMETELAVAKAADALSKMARPIAHDFNNALAAINGYATLIDDDLPAASPIKTEISRIIEAVKRAVVLTSKLQDFARNPKINNGED